MIVLVHGVPETSALWDKVRSHLQHDAVALSLPGFDCTRPPRFGATKDDYAEWLASKLAAMTDPIHLVGHDWGAGLVYRVVTRYSNRIGVRSWITDGLSGMHPDYEWHDFAKIWQTPGEGEDFWSHQLSLPVSDGVPIFESFGVSHEDALALAGMSDETMASCILDLYRSALPNCHATWSDSYHSTPLPGLVMSPSDDPFDDEARSAEVAGVLGARHLVLDTLGHWWALQDPFGAARVIDDFVSSVE
jgi:pimeloyl-ACP methyl ester carboxylesterase